MIQLENNGESGLHLASLYPNPAISELNVQLEHPPVEFIEAALIWLDEHEEIANFHILFLLRLTAFLGFYPEITEMDLAWFNLQEGTFEDQPSGNACETGRHVDDLKVFLGMKFDALSGVKLTKDRRSAVLDLVLLYYQLHLQGYKKPRSLPVLNQLFH